MIFWRTYNNGVYVTEEVDKLGFSLDDPSFIPDEYLEQQEFVILRTCFGVGDWGIISAFPRKLKEKFPKCTVNIPSPELLRSMFGHLEKNWSSWNDPFQVVHTVFDNNPYVDNFVDSFEGEVFNDHFRIYNNDVDEPLLLQLLRFWQFDDFDNIEPELYWSEEEVELGNSIIYEHVGERRERNFGTLLISNRYNDEGREKIQELLDIYQMPMFYWSKSPDHNFKFEPALDLRHVKTRIQLYIKSKAVFNVGNQTGMNDVIANYAPTYTVPRGKLGSNLVRSQIYI
jgi:hypothetical protein